SGWCTPHDAGSASQERASKILSTIQNDERRDEIAARLALRFVGASPTASRGRSGSQARSAWPEEAGHRTQKALDGPDSEASATPRSLSGVLAVLGLYRPAGRDRDGTRNSPEDSGIWPGTFDVPLTCLSGYCRDSSAEVVRGDCVQCSLARRT